MPHSIWILFAVVAAALLVVPGRSKRMVLSYALAHGRKSVFATGTGVALGTAVSVAATLAISWGLISLSTLTFSIFQWIGLFWLMLFGLGLARAPAGIEPVADNDNLPEEKPLRVIAHCFESESRDPRSSLLVAALLPQFLAPAAPFIPQAIALGATFVALSALSCIVYALFPERVRKIVRKHAARRTVNRSGRTVLIAAKAVTAGYRKIAA
ncbi:LysE family translocator [Rhizobium sp. AAP116]|uniref:LysE family translocator n=1 Tax=Rhizobium sp. AAP116 TaxID=1523429 RepID=UPI0006B88F3F|nr:LysE family translocator [Rhizobium sp. AAP116]KPF51679.1 lysine transporter LysE [Rhizobium sp. AAP116]